MAQLLIFGSQFSNEELTVVVVTEGDVRYEL